MAQLGLKRPRRHSGVWSAEAVFGLGVQVGQSLPPRCCGAASGRLGL